MVVTLITKTGMESYMNVSTVKYNREAGTVELAKHDSTNVNVNVTDVKKCSVYDEGGAWSGQDDDGSFNKSETK